MQFVFNFGIADVLPCRWSVFGGYESGRNAPDVDRWPFQWVIYTDGSQHVWNPLFPEVRIPRHF